MQNITILALTRVAPAAVAKRRFVDFDGSQVDVAGAKPLGVSQYDAKAGDAYAVDVLGTSKVEAGVAIPLGPKGLTPLMSAADGRAVPHDGTAGTAIACYALTPATGPGSVIEVLLRL